MCSALPQGLLTATLARADAAKAEGREAFSRRHADLEKRRKIHEGSLGPSMANPNRRQELDALEAAEEHRATESRENINQAKVPAATFPW